MGWKVINKQDLVEIIGKYYIDQEDMKQGYNEYYKDRKLLDSKDEQIKFIIKYLPKVTYSEEMFQYTNELKPILYLFTEIDESIVDVIIENNLSDKLFWAVVFWYIDRVESTNDLSKLDKILQLTKSITNVDTKYIDTTYNSSNSYNIANKNQIIAMLKISNAIFDNTGVKPRIMFRTANDIEYILSTAVNEDIDFKTLLLLRNYQKYITSPVTRNKRDFIVSAWEMTIQDFLGFKGNRLNYLKHCVWDSDAFKKFYDQYEDEINDILIQDLLHSKGFSFKAIVKLINSVFNLSDYDVNNIFLSDKLTDETKSKILLITMSD